MRKIIQLIYEDGGLLALRDDGSLQFGVLRADELTVAWRDVHQEYHQPKLEPLEDVFDIVSVIDVHTLNHLRDADWFKRLETIDTRGYKIPAGCVGAGYNGKKSVLYILGD